MKLYMNCFEELEWIGEMLYNLQAIVSFSADKGFIFYLFQPW